MLFWFVIILVFKNVITFKQFYLWVDYLCVYYCYLPSPCLNSTIIDTEDTAEPILNEADESAIKNLLENIDNNHPMNNGAGGINLLELDQAEASITRGNIIINDMAENVDIMERKNQLCALSKNLPSAHITISLTSFDLAGVLKVGRFRNKTFFIIFLLA